MLSTDITKKEVVYYLVLDKVFYTKEQAEEYVETIKIYNQKYLSADEPVESLLKLIDDEIILNTSPYYHVIIVGLRKNISSKTPYIDRPLIHDCLRNLQSFSEDLIYRIYIELIGEYIEKYGCNRND